MKKGFTLVELLIVLAVIAALMAVATPMAMNAVKQAKASQVAQNLNALKSAVEQYVYSEKDLPATITDLTDYMSKIPDKYHLNSPDDFTNGEATVTIGYTGGDILAEDVNKQYSEATTVQIDGKDCPGVSVQVRQWW